MNFAAHFFLFAVVHAFTGTVPLKRNVALARTSQFARDWIITD